MAERGTSPAVSSPAATLRGFVMLVCLVVLPLLALRGSKWSNLRETLPSLIDRLSSVLGKQNGNSSTDDPARGTMAPPFVAGQAPQRPGNSLSIDRLAGERPFEAMKSTNVTPDCRSNDGPSNVLPVCAIAELGGEPATQRPRDGEGTFAAPRRRAADGGGVQRLATAQDVFESARPSELERGRPDSSRSATSQAEFGGPARAPLVSVSRRDRDGAPLRTGQAYPSRLADLDGGDARSAPMATDRFTYALDRLRELGAVYYLLETWGNEGQRFRFHCKMAVGGNPGYTRRFEATDADPLQAMARVLSDVETWRAGP